MASQAKEGCLRTALLAQEDKLELAQRVGQVCARHSWKGQPSNREKGVKGRVCTAKQDALALAVSDAKRLYLMVC